MKEWLVFITEQAIIVFDGIALVVICFGTLQALFGAAQLVLSFSVTGYERREVWLRYARWLVAGLTFQLAADIIETSITTSWEAVARLAAIAAIRTFLDYFLERDLQEVRERKHDSEARASV